MSDFNAMLQGHLDGHLATLKRLDECRETLAAIAAAWVTALKSGKKILFFGNGGSAADAQHLAAELCVRYRINRRALAGLALTTDTSVLTAHSNDYGFETVFSRQVEALAQPGDVVVGISTSGTSKNVVAGLKAAREAGCVVVSFTAEKGADCAALAHHAYCVPTPVTAFAQECHLLAGHVLCEYVEAAFKD
ncbi:D-sedoheptulose 7-phosphate isomerase [Prosthecobacter dejongeii]|uniref:D-sedoheptulose 7-phosphate isomerase n=1 Tax=Prosthecobacter dejongeii TaxID=48465 RepID=A0A7W8DRL9_9BACT|nr:D-sedoheptulose 7-phosphate isomerase [Prosthecobacter dejongeii]MBB5039587.1 D-sedoheptulose 7-phosphate isomerase [Prosthecobacter dejongeii]